MYRVSILPNRNNQIHIHIPVEKNANGVEDLRAMENNDSLLACVAPCSFPGGSCSKMEPKIVKYSLQLLEKKRCDDAEESEKEELVNQLRRIEARLMELTNNR